MATKVPLTQVVAELIDAQDTSEHQFRRLFNIGVRACRKFNMDIYGAFKSVLLDVSANGTVAWPKDYLDYSTIGIVNSYGEVVPLKHNEGLSTLKQEYLASQMKLVDVPQVDTGLYGNPSLVPFYWLNYGYNNIGYVHLYGIGGGTPVIGEFTVDANNKCFLLAPGWPYSTIMLEYLSDGFDCDCNDYMVDTFAVEAMQWYIRWMDRVDMRKKYSIGDVQYAQQQFVIQRRDARARINKARVNELQVIFRENVKLTARA